MITRQIPPAQLLFTLSHPMTPQRIKKMRRARLLKRFALILTVAAITACALTETLKVEVAENLEADRVEIDELLSNLSAAESSLDDARCELSSVYDDLNRCRR